MPLAPEESKEGFDETQQMMLEAQPETYMWVGHGRAAIRDFVTFVTVFGEKMAVALLLEFGERYPLLIVRNYIGNELLTVDKDRNVFYSHSECLTEPLLREIIERVTAQLLTTS